MDSEQRINKERLLATLIELIKIDSPSGHEQAIGKELKKRFEALGATCTIDKTGNLIARLKGNSANPDDWMLLSAHMDTAGGYTGIRPVVGRGGILKSDGTTILGADDKAGISIILEMFEIAQEDPEFIHPGIEAVISVSEESGLLGSKALDTSQLKSTWGYILDTSGPIGTIVIAAPWTRYFTITVHGVAAHAGVAPEKGVNAVAIFAKAAASLPIGRVDAESVLNIAFVQSDTVRNVVPSLLTATGMARSLQKEKLDKLTEKIMKSFQDEAEKLGGSVDIEVEDAYSGYNLDKRDKTYRIAKKAFDKLGFEVHPKKSTGGTDGNYYNGAGIHCAVLSVGQTDAHSVKETLKLQDLYDAAHAQLEIIAIAGGEK